jgi:hypothetical protein
MVVMLDGRRDARRTKQHVFIEADRWSPAELWQLRGDACHGICRTGPRNMRGRRPVPFYGIDFRPVAREGTREVLVTIRAASMRVDPAILPIAALHRSLIAAPLISLKAHRAPRSNLVTDPIRQARVAALWMVHGAALSKLLRAHGRSEHADNLEAALDEVSDIVAGSVGQPALARALDWVSDQLWDQPGIAGSTARH